LDLLRILDGKRDVPQATGVLTMAAK